MHNLETQFIAAMWSALTDDSDFKPMLSAWDDMFNQGLMTIDCEPLAADLVAKLEPDLIRLEAAFSASIQANRRSATAPRNKDELVISLGQSGQFFSASARLEQLDVNLDLLSQQLGEVAVDNSQTQFIWGQGASSNNKTLLACVPISSGVDNVREYLVQRLETRWKQGYDELVLSLFPLTPTELAVLKALYKGLDSSDIARLRQRSVYTVRSQVKSILDKFGINNQRLLIRLLSSIFHLHNRSQPKTPNRSADTRASIVLDANQCIEYCDYGPSDGQAIFLISPTISPAPSPYFQRLAAQYKLRVIAPFRPGSGKTSRKSHACGPEVVAQGYSQLINVLRLQNPIVVGYASGGLYAIAVATLLGGNCKGVATIDTGYPLVTLGSILALPASARRTFLAAKINRKLLYAPHRIAANDFLSSLEGERRLVEYFFDDQPHDLKRVKSDEYFYRATRNLIHYSLENIERLVDDVSYWAQNWQPLTQNLPNAVPRLAIIGEHNQMFKAADLVQWCERNEWDCEVIEDEGQLLVFSQPRVILDRLLSHF